MDDAGAVGADVDALVVAAKRLGEGTAVVRDYVKSMRHYRDEGTGR